MVSIEDGEPWARPIAIDAVSGRSLAIDARVRFLVGVQHTGIVPLLVFVLVVSF